MRKLLQISLVLVTMFMIDSCTKEEIEIVNQEEHMIEDCHGNTRLQGNDPYTGGIIDPDNDDDDLDEDDQIVDPDEDDDDMEEDNDDKAQAETEGASNEGF